MLVRVILGGANCKLCICLCLQAQSHVYVNDANYKTYKGRSRLRLSFGQKDISSPSAHERDDILRQNDVGVLFPIHIVIGAVPGRWERAWIVLKYRPCDFTLQRRVRPSTPYATSRVGVTRDSSPTTSSTNRLCQALIFLERNSRINGAYKSFVSWLISL
jgi:hypothetical protein